MKVILMGVGGTGNGILAAMDWDRVAGLTLVDPDWVEVSNLNRQFLFDPEDVGQSKVDVARRKLVAEAKGRTKVDAYVTDVEKLPDEIFFDHEVFLLATDNLESRLSVNKRLWEAFFGGHIGSFRLIDCGSDRMRAHVMVVSSAGNGACLECVVDLYQQPDPWRPNHCAISHRLATFEDCIRNSVLTLSEKTGESGTNYPKNSQNIHQEALKLALSAGIKPKDQEFTSGFLKGFSVNFSAVNSMVGGLVCQVIEAASPDPLHNYFSINAENGFHIEPLRMDRSEACPTCRPPQQKIFVSANDLVEVTLVQVRPHSASRWMLFTEEGNLVFDSRRPPTDLPPSPTWAVLVPHNLLGQPLHLRFQGMNQIIRLEVRA